MKSPVAIIVIAFFAAVIGALLGSASRDPAGDGALEVDVGEQVAEAHHRITELEDRLDGLIERVSRTSTPTLAPMKEDDGDPLSAIRAELESLRALVKGSASGESVAGLAELVDARIEHARTVARAEAQKKAAERKKLEQKKWAITTAHKSGRNFARILSLDQDQTSRFTEALEVSWSANAPLFEVLKNEEATSADRLDAIAKARENLYTLSDSARDIFTPDQYRQFSDLRDNNPKGTMTWLANLEARLTGQGSDGGK